jgi:hypothetical protein
LKPVPVTVSVNAWLPTAMDDGLSAVNTGAALWTVNDNAAEVPPPGAGLTTVICAVPAAAISLSRIEAVTCVALTKAVARDTPFQCTAEPATKPEPVAVRVKPAPPAKAATGDTVVRTGTGFLAFLLPPSPQPGTSAKIEARSRIKNRVVGHLGRNARAFCNIAPPWQARAAQDVGEEPASLQRKLPPDATAAQFGEIVIRPDDRRSAPRT